MFRTHFLSYKPRRWSATLLLKRVFFSVGLTAAFSMQSALAEKTCSLIVSNR